MREEYIARGGRVKVSGDDDHCLLSLQVVWLMEGCTEPTLSFALDRTVPIASPCAVRAQFESSPRSFGAKTGSWRFFFSSRRRHTISDRDWSSDVCSSD